MKKNIYGNSLQAGDNTSSIFGIFEGKAKALKEAAAAAAAIAIEKAQQDTLLLKLEAARQGYDPQAAENKAKIDTTIAESSSEKTLYVILAVVVVVVMAGLYFIKKK